MGSASSRAERVFGLTPWRTWAERIRANAPWVLFVALYAVLANIPYWVACEKFRLANQGWFCVQYTAVGLIALILPASLSAILLFGVIFADILCSVCQSYGIPIRECLENIGAADAFSGVRVLYGILVLSLALLAVAMAACLPVRSITRKQKVFAALCLMGFLGATVAADVVSHHIFDRYLPAADRRVTNPDQLDLDSIRLVRVTRSPLSRLAFIEELDRAYSKNEDATKGPPAPAPSAAGTAFSAAGILNGDSRRELPNVALVLVESWGLALDEPLKSALVQPYMDPAVQVRYRVLQGSVPFYGATVSGEARELCGSSIGFGLLKASAADLRNCLPDQLAALGYDRIAVHGMTGYLFDRINWYKTIGFSQALFRDSFRKEGLPDCEGAFVGTCDADVASWIGRRLNQNRQRPTFIYWMTLNSHLPVPVPALVSNPAPCLASIGADSDAVICSWYQMIANVHRSVTQLAMGNLSRPTIFVIVGDHAPPFANPVRHGRFSQTDVPYVILLPQSGGDDSNSAFAQSAPAAAPEAPKPQRQAAENGSL